MGSSARRNVLLYSYIRLLDLYGVTKRMERRHEKMAGRIEEAVEALVERGWVERRGERYALTPAGREEARKPIEDMGRTRELLRKLARPQTVSQVGLSAHLGLAASPSTRPCAASSSPSSRRWTGSPSWPPSSPPWSAGGSTCTSASSACAAAAWP